MKLPMHLLKLPEPFRPVRRFIVSDEDGPLRRFFSREDAEHFMSSDPSLTLEEIAKLKKPKFNKQKWLASLPDAPF